MATGSATLARRPEAERHSLAAINLSVGRRIRERRIILGLTQQALAALIGLTYQQLHKYERGVNRVTSGRLYKLATVLDVDVSYFFKDVAKAGPTAMTARQRSMLELSRNFVHLPSRKHQEALCNLARALTNGPLPIVPGIDDEVGLSTPALF